MRKGIFVSLLSVCTLLVFTLAGLQAYDFEVPESMVMDHSEGETENPQYSPTEMPHKTHEAAVEDCQSCHHMWEDESEPPQKCTDSGCHDLLGAKGSDMKEVNSAYYAFHERGSEHSCIGCHQELKKAGEDTGPLPCNKCHPKD
ncbi:MAG: cytochrome c3 family protein [Desulfohalobiaceae bacterium]